MERLAGEDEIADNGGGAPTLAKRKRPAIDGASSSATAVGACDDTVGTILARLPTRTAIACTALSKHHRSLIRSPAFRSLHCCLGAPLPSPHVAYLAAARIRRRPEPKEDPASGYYGFHLAGNGPGLAGADDAPIRSVAGWRYLGTKCVNTCNGVLLLATKGFSSPCRCTFWNPAIADATREATISEPPSSEEKTSAPVVRPNGKEIRKEEIRNKETQFMALGLGYNRRSNTYKLLLCRMDRYHICVSFLDRQGKTVCCRTGGLQYHFEYSLVAHSLGGSGGDPAALPLRTVLSSMETWQSSKGEVGKQIFRQKSLYVDGKIYFVYLEKDQILTFNVDDETVHAIDMPSKPHPAYGRRSLELIDMSGRPSLVINDNDCVALWLITANYQLEPMQAISSERIRDYYDHKIAGIWDCGGILLLWFYCSSSTDELLLYDVKTKKIFIGDVPHDLTVKKSDYVLCWGYKPTLVSPESVVGEFNQDLELRRGRSADITEVVNPLLLQDRRKGQKVTLNIVCLMKFLVRIMQKMPHDFQDVVEMPKMDSDEPGSLFQCFVSN